VQGARPSVARIVHLCESVRLASLLMLAVLVLAIPARAFGSSPSPDAAPHTPASAGANPSPAPDPAAQAHSATSRHSSDVPAPASPSATPLPSGGSVVAVPTSRATSAVRPTITPKLALPRERDTRAVAHRRVKHRSPAVQRRVKRKPPTLLASAEVAPAASRNPAGLLLLMSAVAMGVVVVASVRLRHLLAQFDSGSFTGTG
jgi:hypothetical protein